MKKLYCVLWICLLTGFLEAATKSPRILKEIILEKKQIIFDNFPKAHNPSLIAVKGGFLFTFRYCPDPNKCWNSYIGITLLDTDFKEIIPPHLLNTRLSDDLIISQAEDARIFEDDGKIYVVYNDNMDLENPTQYQRRDIHIAEVLYDGGRFILGEPVKLIHQNKYATQMWQKNWSPFSYQNQLYFIYSPDPHEIIEPDFASGICTKAYSTKVPLQWKWGKMRGGTPAVFVDGEYLAFFHSAIEELTSISSGVKKWHYYMGAYTFTAKPPFCITKATPFPISTKGFYVESGCDKRVIYPGGFAATHDKIYLAYGKDDCEMWIATLDKARLKKMLKPVQ